MLELLIGFARPPADLTLFLPLEMNRSCYNSSMMHMKFIRRGGQVYKFPASDDAAVDKISGSVTEPVEFIELEIACLLFVTLKLQAPFALLYLTAFLMHL